VKERKGRARRGRGSFIFETIAKESRHRQLSYTAILTKLKTAAIMLLFMDIKI
jgi:hypothetical protein